MTAIPLSPVDGREVVRCAHCQLVQFPVAAGICRRCRKVLFPEPDEFVEPEPCHGAEEAFGGPARVSPVGDLVRILRRELRLSQGRLAAKAGVPRTFISKIEIGKTDPTLATIEKMAAALGVSLATFLDGLTTPETSLAVVLSDHLNRRIIPYLKHLSDEDKSEILYQAKKMAAASNAHGGQGPTVH